MAKTNLLQLKNVSKFYYNKGMVSSGFTKVNLTLNLGEFVVITGESGSGKSTLLHVLSGLDSYEEGEMYINGQETSHYTEKEFEEYRKTYIGNIFQSFNLVNSYTVYQNIELVLLLNGYKKKEIKSKIDELIDKVGLTKYRKTKVSKLSGGQKQRVAIARALAKDTPIIIADEPTGNLDSASAKSVIKLLSEVSKEKLVVLVTHNYDQVEEYATRKIEMHDGKIREDLSLKETKPIEPDTYEYKDLTFTNKVRLGFRNTFNIFGKFILTFLVFLFVCVSFLNEYAGMKSVNYTNALAGYNSYFTNYDTKRIVFQKKDKTEITEDEFNKIKKINHVSEIDKDDLFVDSTYNINTDDYSISFWGTFNDISKIKKVDVGRLPEKDNEIVLSTLDAGSWFINEDILNKELNIYDSYQGFEIPFDNKIVIVGYNLLSYDDYERDEFYATEKTIETLRKTNTVGYAKTFFTVDDEKIRSTSYNYAIMPNNNVPKGEAYYSADMNYLCKYEYCRNREIKIDVSTMYFDDTVTLKFTNQYTKYNYTNLTGRNDFDNMFNTIFISNEDYNYLYNKGTFQSSVFVDKEQNVSSVNKALKKLGMNTLVIKDNLSNDMKTIMAVLKIIRVIVFVGEFVFLFFISYFVIKLIQKSKNVYYATVRILGGSKNTIKDLIKAELLTVFHIAYILVCTGVLILKLLPFTIPLYGEIIDFLSITDCIFIYIVLLVMSLLIAGRYSRKLFKSSAMKAYREEV